MPHKSLTLLTLASLSLIAGSLGAQTILDETWAGGDRSTQDLPNSAQWFVANGSTTVTTANGSITLNTLNSSGANAANEALAYFTAAGNPVTVGVGQALKLSYDFSFGEIVGNEYFRIGLFDSSTSKSGTKRISADGSGRTNSAFVGYTGYLASDPGITTGKNSISKRRSDATSNGLMNSTGAAVYTTLKTGTAWGGYVADATYTGVVLIAHNDDDTITLTHNVYDADGGLLYSISTIDTSSIYTQFDTIAFDISSAATKSLTLGNVKIELASIPEPSTLAAFTALAATGALLIHRRRKRRLA